jgi:hypothetical protein
MSQGVFTNELRFQWVKGWLTGGTDPEDGSVECGAQTQYPVEIVDSMGRSKLDILAEIFYRVKDAQFTSGSFGIDAFGENSILQITSTPPTAALATFVGIADIEAASVRGYCATANLESPAQPLADYGASLFGEAYYQPSGYSVSIAARDIANSEYALWVNGSSDIPKSRAYVGWFGDTFTTLTDFAPSTLAAPFRTGFTQEFQNTFYPEFFDLYGIYGNVNDEDGLSYCNIYIRPTVAFIDSNDSGNPYDPANRIFLGLAFQGYVLARNPSNFEIYLVSDDSVIAGPMLPAEINVTLKLSDGVELSAPLFFDSGTESISFDPDYIKTGYDFVIEAVEWFPYAKDSPASPVWDAATGEKL